MNETNRNISKQEHQNESCSNRMIRSPVQLDIPISQNSTPTHISIAEVEQTISDVIEGKGIISINDESKSILSKQNRKQSLSSQLVFEQNESKITTKTNSSSLDEKTNVKQ